MNHLEAGRILMGDSLAMHIIFALLGVGLPFVMLIFEYIAIRKKDNALRENVKLWSYVAAVLVITGVLSGTVIALQMFLIWPGILNYGGKAISPAFMLEGYAFIIEAVFLTFYVKTWDTLRGFKHWLIGVPVLLGATLSAFLITAVDAWMNHPTGFTLVDGKVTDPHPWQAIFSTTSLIESGHSILSYYLTASLIMVGIYAWVLLRGKKPKAGDAKTAQLIIRQLVAVSFCLLLLIAVFGDLSGKYLAKHEPAKLAALELTTTTQTNAPLILGGSALADGTAQGGVRIPGALSFLVGGTTSTQVQGLDQTPPSLWPPFVIHTLFDIKLLLIAALTLVPLGFFAALKFAKKMAFGKPMLFALVVLPFVSLASVELGWMITELGRQPYAVYGHVLTADAYTRSAGVIGLAWLFPTVFVLLIILTIIAVKLTVKRYQPSTRRK